MIDGVDAGLADPAHPLGRALWIWPDDYEGLQNAYADFRRDFELQRVPERLMFWITADQQYMLYVNGAYLGRGPARGYQAHWPVDGYDLAPHLRAGRNWISIRGYNAGVSTYQYLHQRAAGLLCASDPEVEALRSDKAWACRVSPAYRRDVARLSKQLNYQEHVDATRDDQAWIRSAEGAPSWGGPKAARTFGCMPWHGLEPRGIPLLTKAKVPYARAIAATQGACAPDAGRPYNLIDPLRREWAGQTWSDPPAVECDGDALCLKLGGAGRGRFSAVTLDLGRPGVGTVCVGVAGGGPEQVLDLYACEVLRPDLAPFVPEPRRACWASMAARLRLNHGATEHEFFQVLGHRYLTLVLRDAEAALDLRVALRETRYPLEVTGRFECSDQLLNDIHRVSVQTQRVCMLDAYVDTPWREQAQWWGDARVQAQNTFHLADDVRLLARGIRSVAAQEVPNGLTYGHAPTASHHCILPDFTLIWLLTLWDHHYQTGSTSLFREMLPRAERALRYFAEEAPRQAGLLAQDPRYWLFLDWSNLHKQGVPTLYNLWYLLTLQKLAELARMSDEPSVHDRLIQAHDHHREALERLWSPTEGLLRDGLDTDGQPVDCCSVATQTLAILAGFGPEHHQTMIERRLLPYLQGSAVPGARPSSFWVTYVYQTMAERGFAREVVEHLRHWWAPMVPIEGTTEQFVNVEASVGGFTSSQLGEVSCTHAWSAHPIRHLAGTVGGVRQAAPAWREIIFEPLLTAAHHAHVAVPTPQGLIQAQWRRDAEEAQIELELPDPIKAEVRLPGVHEPAVTGSRRWSVPMAALEQAMVVTQEHAR